jgi:streptomycin 3"-adenylyltransferase
MVTRQRGVCLVGAAIAEVFPAVPKEDYIASIMGDVRDGLEKIDDNPVYGILNACRTYAYLRDGHIYSKVEGGVWALGVVPEPVRPAVMWALAVYRGEPETSPIESSRLDIFATYMRRILL